MMRYFKAKDNSFNETRFSEFDGDWACREIVVRPDITLLLKQGEQSECSLAESKLDLKDEITREEFQATWEHYL